MLLWPAVCSWATHFEAPKSKYPAVNIWLKNKKKKQNRKPLKTFAILKLLNKEWLTMQLWMNTRPQNSQWVKKKKDKKKKTKEQGRQGN